MPISTRRAAAVSSAVAALTATLALLLAGPASAADYWTPMVIAVDEKGQQVPVRFGDPGFGWTKACQKHNLCNLDFIHATIEGHGDLSDEGGGRFKYQGHLIGGSVGHLTLIVIADLNTRTRLGSTPDGLGAGVITAYCDGMLRCPDEVNTG